MDRTACSDIKKAYINNYPYAIDYVKENMSFFIKDLSEEGFKNIKHTLVRCKKEEPLTV